MYNLEPCVLGVMEAPCGSELPTPLQAGCPEPSRWGLPAGPALFTDMYSGDLGAEPMLTLQQEIQADASTSAWRGLDVGRAWELTPALLQRPVCSSHPRGFRSISNVPGPRSVHKQQVHGVADKRTPPPVPC